MTEKLTLQEAHHKFSAGAHNAAMDILYSDNPSSEDVDSLLELAHVAHWHWLRRNDKAPQNLSVALWLLSRAYSANGYGSRALDYAKDSLAMIENEDLLPSFYGYANEALARAHILLGNLEDARSYLNRAMEIAETVPNLQARSYLLDQIHRVDI